MNRTSHTSRSRRRIALITVLAALASVLVFPQSAGAITPVYPESGAHLTWTLIRPTVAFDVPSGEKPKWVLVGTDAEMTNTVRYCRQFTGVTIGGKLRWGCSAWAIGADSYGQDVLKPLTWGSTYYWTVVYTDADGNEQRSEIQAFAIDDEPNTGSVSDISNQIFGSVVGDGTNLNLGAAAQVNSHVTRPTIRSRRRSTYRFQILVRWRGMVDTSRSYIKIRSRAGTHYVRVKHTGAGKGVATWTLSRSERRLSNKRFTYQAFLKAKANGAMVRSAPKVLLIKRRKPPAWHRT